MITEGSTKLWVIKQQSPRPSTNIGPGSASELVFFNPAMEFNRDLSVLVIDRFIKDRIELDQSSLKLLDGLAGTGARGVRFGSEIEDFSEHVNSIVINDKNPFAFNIINRNIELNELTNAKASNDDLNSLLVNNRFDYIDIDPFGSPINFLDSGTRMCRNNGILAVTATDTATLFGSYPATCLRRYDACACKTAFGHELGIRILIGACIRTGARYNNGFKPIIVHATDHYYRIYLKANSGRSAADSALNELGYFLIKEGTNQFEVIKRNEFFTKHINSVMKENFNAQPSKWSNSKLLGPAWLGALFDNSFTERLDITTHELGTRKKIEKQLSLWLEEANSPPGFYDVNLLASELHISTPPLGKIINNLKTNGYFATKTHFNPNAFKTDADYSTICLIMKDI